MRGIILGAPVAATTIGYWFPSGYFFLDGVVAITLGPLGIITWWLGSIRSNVGTHTFHLWMRENGFRADQVLLTQNPNYTP